MDAGSWRGRRPCRRRRRQQRWHCRRRHRGGLARATRGIRPRILMPRQRYIRRPCILRSLLHAVDVVAFVLEVMEGMVCSRRSEGREHHLRRHVSERPKKVKRKRCDRVGIIIVVDGSDDLDTKSRVIYSPSNDFSLGHPIPVDPTGDPTSSASNGVFSSK
jgi:hypothetical protein